MINKIIWKFLLVLFYSSASGNQFQTKYEYVENCTSDLMQDEDGDNFISQDDLVSYINGLCEAQNCNPTEDNIYSDSFNDLPFALQYYFALASCDNPLTYNETMHANSSIVQPAHMHDNESIEIIILAMDLNYRSHNVCLNNSTDIDENETIAIGKCSCDID